jgi:hypothetical protein
MPPAAAQGVSASWPGGAASKKDRQWRGRKADEARHWPWRLVGFCGDVHAQLNVEARVIRSGGDADLVAADTCWPTRTMDWHVA